MLAQIENRDLSDTTFCSGFWTVEGNRRRSRDRAFKLIRRTCRLIAGGNLVVFHDDDEVRAAYEASARRNGIRIVARRLPLADLPGAAQGSALAAHCAAMELPTIPNTEREKGVRHRLEFDRLGPQAYAQLVSIWISKPALVARHTMDADPFGSHRFAWIDASVSRFNRKRQNWNFRHLAFPPDALSHYGNLMLYRGRRLPLNASFLLGTRDVWSEVEARFAARLERALEEPPYAHDEETILGLCHAESPELFSSLGDMHGKLRRKFARYLAPFQV